MRENFGACLAQILKFEGGYSNDKNDPGGATLNGITQAAWDSWQDKNQGPRSPVRSMPSSERDKIYRSEYWGKVGGDNLPAGADLAVTDLAVNSGVVRALRMWQAAEPDASPVGVSIVKLCSARLAFMRSLKTWPEFGDGWSKRVAEVERLALAMTYGHPPQKPLPRSAPASGVVVAGGAAAAGAAAYGVDIAWIIGIVILAAALAINLWLGEKPEGTAKAHEPAPLPVPVPASLTPELDTALADMEIKKAAYKAALSAVAVEKDKVNAKIAALNAAVSAINGKLTSSPEVELRLPLEPSKLPMETLQPVMLLVPATSSLQPMV